MGSFGLPTGGTHAAAFGYTNPEWVVDPLAEFRVERLLLLEMPGHDRARAKLAKSHFDLDVALPRAVPIHNVVEVDLWNPGQVGRVLIQEADRLKAEGQGPLWANISTGPNPWCIGASLAASFADVHVYHVTRDGKGIVRIPSIAQKRPTNEEIALIANLPSDGGEISGRRLRKRLREAGFFDGSTPEKPMKGRETGQLASALRRPVQWHAIEQRKHGERNVY